MDILNYKEICSEGIQSQITDTSHLRWTRTRSLPVCSLSIVEREKKMLAILMTIKASAQLLKELTVQVLTENISFIAFINHLGGPSPELPKVICMEAI